MFALIVSVVYSLLFSSINTFFINECFQNVFSSMNEFFLSEFVRNSVEINVVLGVIGGELRGVERFRISDKIKSASTVFHYLLTVNLYLLLSLFLINLSKSLYLYLQMDFCQFPNDGITFTLLFIP